MTLEGFRLLQQVWAKFCAVEFEVCLSGGGVPNIILSYPFVHTYVTPVFILRSPGWPVEAIFTS